MGSKPQGECLQLHTSRGERHVPGAQGTIHLWQEEGVQVQQTSVSRLIGHTDNEAVMQYVAIFVTNVGVSLVKYYKLLFAH